MLVYTLNRLAEVLENERDNVIFKQLGKTGKQGVVFLDRRSAPRQVLPYSTAVCNAGWISDMIKEHGLESTVRDPGHPRKAKT
jgi:hypothetical protein